MKKTYELWEIMKDGKNEEIFEVASCVLSSYVGQKVKVSAKKVGLKSYKCLVDPDSTGDGESALAKLYGCLGTAKFEKVEQFVGIGFEEALKMLSEFRVIYSKKYNQYSEMSFSDEYVEISRYTDFEDIDIADFSDLMSRTFYKKG